MRRYDRPELERLVRWYEGIASDYLDAAMRSASHSARQNECRTSAGVALEEADRIRARLKLGAR